MATTSKMELTDETLTRKVWVITGTSAGLGRSLVNAALARGDYVVATARDITKITDFTDRRDSEAMSRLHVVKLDVTAPFSELHVLAEEILGKWGRVDVLVNNAGSCLLGITEEIGVEGYQKQFAVNFFGQLNVTNAFLPYMRDRRKGTIVFVGSRSSWRSNVPLLGPYASSKAALTAAAESLAVEVAPLGIKVLNVLPGGLKQSRTWFNLVFLPTVPEALLPTIAKQTDPESLQAEIVPSERSSELTEAEDQHIADYAEIRNRSIAWAGASSSSINGDLHQCAKTIVDVVSGDAHGRSMTADGGHSEKRTWPDLNMLILGVDAEANIGDKCRAILKNLDEWKDVVRGIELDKSDGIDAIH